MKEQAIQIFTAWKNIGKPIGAARNLIICVLINWNIRLWSDLKSKPVLRMMPYWTQIWQHSGTRGDQGLAATDHPLRWMAAVVTKVLQINLPQSLAPRVYQIQKLAMLCFARNFALVLLPMTVLMFVLTEYMWATRDMQCSVKARQTTWAWWVNCGTHNTCSSHFACLIVIAI